MKVCSKCLSISYCSKEHQVADWKEMHKYECYQANMMTREDLKGIKQAREKYNRTFSV